MPFYKDMNRKGPTKPSAKVSWEDEGSRYTGAGARARSARPDQPAFGKRNPDTRTLSGGRYPDAGARARSARPDQPAFDKRNDKREPYAEHDQRVHHPVPEPRKVYERYEYRPPVTPVPKPLPREDIAAGENLLSGRNPIREALKNDRDIEKLLVARGELSGTARAIVMMAKEKHIPVQEVDRTRLDAITQNHQGLLAFTSAYQYAQIEDMLSLAKERGENPFLVILDGITDPHNLGAIIRTAECAGAHGVIVPARRSVGLTPAAVKASAGAVEYLPVARVTNLTRLIESLRKEGIWSYAADTQGEDYHSVDFRGGVALVIGAEGDGVSRLVLETCDRRVALPLKGRIEALNASVAAGVLMYSVLHCRAEAELP